MNFLKKMPIATKIFLIPGIAALSFIIYLLITVYTALNNGATLEKVQKVQFPALQLSASTLVDMQKVRDTLASAVTTGDEDTLTMAQELAEEAKSGLNHIASISPEFRSEIPASPQALIIISMLPTTYHSLWSKALPTSVV